MTTEPSFDSFKAAWEAGRPQVAFRRLIDDLETPVSAYLKIARERPYAFLFESVEGGAWRGRYSIVAMKPDLVWRCRGDAAEVAEGEAIAADRFTPQTGGALDSLRDLVARSRIDLPAGLPPPAAGIYGAIGYDMVRLVEKLPNINADELGLPDAVMIRPSIVAVFDAIAQEIVLVTPARPVKGVSAEAAWAEANARLDAVMADLRRPLPAPAPDGAPGPDIFETKVSRKAYADIVEKAKAYIRAGDIFQVVPSHRFRAPFKAAPFALYRSLRRTNPSPFLFYLNFGPFQLVGSSPEILVRLRDGKVTIRPKQAIEFRTKLMDSKFFSSVVVEELTPVQNNQRVNFRITAQWKGAAEREALQLGPVLPEAPKTNAAAGGTNPPATNSVAKSNEAKTNPPATARPN